ncbi:MAG: NAD-dependent epimerase/dehydratase family protein [Pseudomonadota bacterium]
MLILLTGGCGFVGVNLSHYLLSRGHKVRVLDNMVLGSPEALEGLEVDLIEGDIRDVPTVEKAIAGVDAVVHLAADTRVIPSIEAPRFNFENNVIGTFNLIEAMRAAGTERLVSASTGGAILGEVEPPVHEGMVPEPISPYGASKLACEGYLSAYAGSYGMKASSLRFTNVYGPRSFHKGSVVAHFIKQILKQEDLVVYGDGSQARDYIYVDDLCQGIVSCLDRGAAGVIQLGTGVPTPLNDLIAILRDVAGKDGYSFNVRYKDWRPGEIRHTYGLIDKAGALLDFAPQVKLPDGIQSTWEWFQGQGYGLRTA